MEHAEVNGSLLKLGKFIKRLFAFLIVAIVVFVAASYLRVEYYTIRYGGQFEELYKQTRMIDSVDYCKVLEHSSSYAKICYVKRKTNVYVIEFNKTGSEEWQICEWNCVWSGTGSADDLMWPLYF